MNERLQRRAWLFHPEPRLGWVFRDINSARRYFAYGPPTSPPPPYHLQQKIQAAEQQFQSRMGTVLPISIVLFLIFFLMGGCTTAVSHDGTGFAAFMVLALVFSTPGAILLIVSATARTAARQELENYHQQTSRQFAEAQQVWQQQKTAHDGQETHRLSQMPEWGSADLPVDSRRLDVFGGTVWGWEALVTVFGASTLSKRPLLILDLSRESVAEELIRLAERVNVPVDTHSLPADLPTSTLLTELEPGQIIDALVESIHGDDPQASMAGRAVDERILGKLLPVLGENVSMARLAAGLRTLMGEPDDTRHLTAAERTQISDELFSDDYVRHAHDSLRRLESHIHPLEALGSAAAETTRGYLTCIALDREASNVRSELLTHLLVQWLTHGLLTDYAIAPAIMVVGADDLARRHLERLSDVCERRGVQLTYMFRHLREEQSRQLGGGTTAFLRLGNAEEAARAADYIGRGHKFVLSQLTRTLGGEETHGVTETEGESETDTLTVGWSTSWTKNWTSGEGGSSRSFGRSSTRSESRSHSVGRNWSTAVSQTHGTNWSTAQTVQRVYEYTVEPTEIQHLPDYGMLLTHSSARSGPAIKPVEFDPAIVMRDRVSLAELPELEIPETPAWILRSPPPPAQQVPAGGMPLPVNQQWQTGWQQGAYRS